MARHDCGAGRAGDAYLTDKFNQSQNAVEVQQIYKGGYGDVLNATIAASRAGQAPHIAQIFEVGTGTMLAAGKAIKEVWELVKETGVHIDPKTYIPSVRGYYSLADGRMASMPFNSSTAVMWYSKDAFRKAGLDPDKPPVTWEEVHKAADTIKTKNAAEIPSTSAWLSWIQLEQYSALHNIPFASEADGFEGLGAKLEINSKAHVKHMARLVEMSKQGSFKYTGRDNAPDQLLVAGKAGIHFNSSGMRGDLVKSAKYDWGEAYLPYDPDIIKQPLELDHRRCQPVDDDGAGPHAGGIQGGRHVPGVPGPAGKRRLLARAHRLCAGDDGRIRSGEAAGILPEEPRRRPAGAATGAWDGDQVLQRTCGWAACPRSATSFTRKWKKPSRATRPRSRRWTAQSSAATRCCASSKGR